jgi:hypothetical protein
MVLRAQFKCDPNRQLRPGHITTMPGSSMAAFLGRAEAAAPIIHGLVDLHAMVAVRVACLFKVLYCARQTSLLVFT